MSRATKENAQAMLELLAQQQAWTDPDLFAQLVYFIKAVKKRLPHQRSVQAEIQRFSGRQAERQRME
jgi:hypothetical protein